MDGSRHPLPVDVSSLTLLAAVLGECRMRSAEQYISSARKWHVTSGHPWTQQLDQVQRDLGRALKRGRGPPSKAAELRWKESVTEFKKQIKHPTQEAMQTWTSWCVAKWWLLREIEVASLRMDAGCISFSRNQTGTRTATIRLGSTKTDIQGNGVERTWRASVMNIG